VRPRRRALRRPPPPDPYAVEERVIVEPGRDPRWIFVWLLAIGVVAALLVFLFFATRDDDDGGRRAAPRVQVPRVLGLDHVAAGERMEEAGLVADTFPVAEPGPAGRVLAQSPPPARRVRRGTIVRLEVARRLDAARQILVPNVTGLRDGEARALLRRAELTVRTIFQEAPEDDQVGTVVRQTPRPDEEVGPLDQVTLYVGR
jgi:eukaryotic-like serine/threonine-protein kinase